MREEGTVGGEGGGRDGGSDGTHLVSPHPVFSQRERLPIDRIFKNFRNEEI